MKLLLMRHAKTNGNLEHRYVGRTDEPLCAAGCLELEKKIEVLSRHPFFTMAKRQEFLPLFVSPMCRCVQTSNILIGRMELACAKVQEESELREMDFGEFEYRNYEELNGRADYQRYIDTGGAVGFPGAEPLEAFKRRCSSAFARVIAGWENRGFAYGLGVVHGGTIMAVLEHYAIPHKDYFSWQVNNCGGFLVQADGFRNLVQDYRHEKLATSTCKADGNRREEPTIMILEKL